MLPFQPAQDDIAFPFQLDVSSLRGRLVRMGSSLDEILSRHDYPSPIAKLLAETTCLAATLATALKYEGVFTLQTKSDGAVRFLVADVTGEGGVRSYAQFDPAKLEAGNELIGAGHLAFTVSGDDVEKRYQGIVPLSGGNLAEAVQNYFRQSEQIPTGLLAAAARDENGKWRGGALMLQRMPREGGNAIASDTSVEDDWIRAMTLMQTCKAEELTDPDLSGEELLFRLFHEEEVRVYEPKPLFHKCRCSEERVRGMLAGMPKEDVAALAVNGIVEVTCEFCNRAYPIPVKEIF
jgi:molecular chaperone Hsp33